MVHDISPPTPVPDLVPAAERADETSTTGALAMRSDAAQAPPTLKDWLKLDVQAQGIGVARSITRREHDIAVYDIVEAHLRRQTDVLERLGYTDRYRWLSNASKTPFTVAGQGEWPSVKHYCLAMLFPDGRKDLREFIRRAPTALEARAKAEQHRNEQRPHDPARARRDLMTALWCKFVSPDGALHPLGTLLLSTRGRQLIEAPHQSLATFFQKNDLGLLLTALRDGYLTQLARA
jgi:predicted NAD-dependent protein-ADP-ribosyltransferase YbiA (DUF1768 family)